MYLLKVLAVWEKLETVELYIGLSYKIWKILYYILVRKFLRAHSVSE